MADDNLAAVASASSPHVSVDAAGDSGGTWLQLGLAVAAAASASSSGDTDGSNPPPTPVKLSLFTCGYVDNQHTTTVGPPLFPLPLRSYQYDHGRYRSTAASRSTMSTPFLPSPFRSSRDAMRVISPPRRTQAIGLWLTLQAAPNQLREPILPQIPESYLRIKDGNMKVEVVIKYLADKLGLKRPYQVELTCRGQVLPPSLPVKHVRDNIWCSSSALREEEEEKEAVLAARRSLPVDPTDHVMTLCYYTTSTNRTLARNL